MASVFLTRIGDRYGITQRRLDFDGAAASPTPEPGSLLLFGMGAVMLIRRRASAHL
jgi:PEP-CTERM motif-containing protein